MNVIDIIKNTSAPLFLIQMYTSNDLKKDMLFFKPLSDKEYQYLNEIGEHSVIELFDSKDSIRFIKELRKLNKYNKIIVDITDKKNFNKDLFSSDINYDNVFVKVNIIASPISLNEYVNNENILFSMIKPAKDLSPLERYLYAYDVVKKLKEYKENHKDKLASRNLYSILYNDYIVCSGFTAILGDLLDKLDIPNVETGVEITMSSYKAIAQLKKKYDWNNLSASDKYKLVSEQMNFIPQNDFEKHSRLIVNINDSKYDVNGLYFSDVTWDNALSLNYYNHALMTTDKTVKSNNKLKLSSKPDELLYSKDINEFYDKINYALNHVNDNVKDNDNLIVKTDDECLKDLVSGLINILSKLDNEFVTFIKAKYKSINNTGFYKTSECKELLSDLGNYIINKFNNNIDGETILSAVKVIYNGVYENGIKKSELDEIMKANNDHNIFEFGDSIFKKKNK